MNYSVCVLIQNDEGKILSVSRKDDKTKWSFPGGKVELNESLEEAICREAYEEAGINLIDPRPIFISKSGTPGYQCVCYLATKFSGTPSKISDSEGEVDWRDWSDLLSGPFADYYLRLIEDISDTDPFNQILKLPNISR